MFLKLKSSVYLKSKNLWGQKLAMTNEVPEPRELMLMLQVMYRTFAINHYRYSIIILRECKKLICVLGAQDSWGISTARLGETSQAYFNLSAGLLGCHATLFSSKPAPCSSWDTAKCVDTQHMRTDTHKHSTAVILGGADDEFVGGKSTSVLFLLTK